MGTTRRFNRTPANRKRLTLDVDVDGVDVAFTFNTRVTTEVARQVVAIEASEDVETLPTFLRSRVVATSTENEPAEDFDRADFDFPEMQDLLKEILANGGMDLGESQPSSTSSSVDGGSSPTTSNGSTDSTSTTSANELTASGSTT